MNPLDRDKDGDVDRSDLTAAARQANAALVARSNTLRATAIVGISMFMLGLWVGALLFGG